MHSPHRRKAPHNVRHPSLLPNAWLARCRHAVTSAFERLSSGGHEESQISQLCHFSSTGGPMSTPVAASRVVPVMAISVTGAMTSGCETIGTIFKAGVWVGAVAVIAVIALVAF